MKIDYIIVGIGLAGIAFCEQLRKHNKSFIVLDDNSQQSSKVAGGLYNPVVLKRFTAAWKALELLEKVLPFYNTLEEHLNVKFNNELPILRIFNSTEEQNNWFEASDKPVLSEFLSTKIIQNKNPEINADFGLGKVLHTGRIDTQALLVHYSEKLRKEKKLILECFHYSEIVVNEQDVKYKDIMAKHIVFAEGFGIKRNPYFSYLPLRGSKGEYITIKAPDLKLNYALKGSVFVIPLEQDTYLVGATYDNEDTSKAPTELKKEELLKKLKKIINCEFKVIGHVAGIRPTVKDRRPLVGRHPRFNTLAVLNGLGTRGVMIAPFLAEQLYNHIENEIDLDPEINISRFNNTLKISP